jgi:glycosyltransferase involved in cell wall biosynthesis
MKILLLGELSGLHEELRFGLLDQGHQVVTACVGQASATYPLDIRLYKAPHQNRIGWAREILTQSVNLPRLTGFDIVQMISPKFFHWKVNRAFVRFLKRFNRALVVINTGCTTGYNDFVRELRFSPCAECKLYDQPTHECVWERDEEREFEHWMWNHADGIVTTAWEYERALATTRFIGKNHPIPLPIDTRRHRPQPWQRGPKVRIYYGETRHGYKGGRSIAEALAKLEASPFASKVEIIKASRMPFDDYLALLDTVDIVIDQSNSHCYGMNALYTIARGKISFTGAAPEAMGFFGIGPEESPFVNVGPDPGDIFAKLVKLIQDPQKMDSLSAKGREFAVRIHDAQRVARAYGAMYQELLDRNRLLETVQLEQGLKSGAESFR